MPNISIAAYTRAEDKAKRLHVKVYPLPVPSPDQMEVRVGDVCFYLNVDDARVMAEAMLAAIREAAIAA